MDWRSAPDATSTVAARAAASGRHDADPSAKTSAPIPPHHLDAPSSLAKQFLMLQAIVKRIALGAGVVIAVVTLTFLLINMAPGDPARLWVGPGAGQEELDAARRALGLDRPLPVRYARWLGDFITGDWGMSLAQQRPVTQVIAGALPLTVLLSAASLLLTYLGGVVMGAFQANRARSPWDRTLTVLALVVYGMPAYWLAVMLILVFAYASARYGWPQILRFPAMGVVSLDADFLGPWGRFVDRLWHLALPLVTLAGIGIAGTSRFVRGAVLDARQQPFVGAARARGLSSAAIQCRYIQRNALMPVITLAGLSLPALFSGTVFVEVIFAWPGMGREIVGAVAARDYPVVLASTAIFAALVVVGNLVADLLYAWVDPRLREPGP